MNLSWWNGGDHEGDSGVFVVVAMVMIAGIHFAQGRDDHVVAMVMGSVTFNGYHPL